MYCERYKCSMPEKTCLLRQNKIRQAANGLWVDYDPGCKNCDQGKAVLAAYENDNYTQKEKNMDLKKCPKCKRKLPADDTHFYKDARSKSGLTSWCRDCQRSPVSKETPPISAPPEPYPIIGTLEHTLEEIPIPEYAIVLDFSEYTSLHEWLVTEAWANVRTPTEQALWLIMSGKKEKEQHECR